MAYLLIISFILFYAYFIKIDLRKDDFYKYFFPIFLVMFLVYAFQKAVGTDYYNYLKCATPNPEGMIHLNYYIRIKEYLFAFLLYISQCLKYPQMIFVLTSLIQNILFAISMKKLNDKNISVFYFIVFYFILSLSFFNQFNVIRQFISIQFIFTGCLFLFNNEFKKSIVLFICAPFFHKSSILMLLFVFVFDYLFKKNNFFHISKKYLLIFSFILFCFYFIDFNSIVFYISRFFGIYENYITNIYTNKMTFLNIITKILKLVVIYFCVYRLHVDKLNVFEKKLYTISFFSIFIMILSFSSTLIWRIYLFFDMFVIFPVLFYFKYSDDKKSKFIIVLYLAIFILIKILIIPHGEYLYQSVF